MTADWAMVVLTFIGLVITILIAVVGNLFQAVKETKKELNAHKLYVANNYPKNEELEKQIEKLSDQMKQGFEHLQQILEAKMKR